MEKISLLIPTRGRPVLLKGLLDSLVNTVDVKSSLEVLLLLDKDDPLLEDTKELLGKYASEFSCHHYMNEESVKLCGALWNILSKKASGDIRMLGNDDMVFRTKGWDKEVRGAFKKYEDRILLVWGEDLINGASHAALPFIHKKWIDILGYFTPCGERDLGTFYNDTWIFDISKRLGRAKFLKNIEIEHLHFSASKMEADSTTKMNRLGNNSNESKKRFEDLVKLRIRDSELLRSFMNPVTSH